MDSFWLFILFVFLSIAFDKLGKKKKPVPKLPPREQPLPPPAQPGKPRELGFEVPKLEGAPEPERPSTVQDEQGVWHEADSILQEQLQALEEAERDRRQDEERERRESALREAEARAYAAQAKLPGQAAAHRAPAVEAGQLRAAVIWSEILGKPKALRRR